MRKIVTAIEGIIVMIMFIAIAGVDDMTHGDLCGFIAVASALGLFVMAKLEENYEFGK